MRHLQCIIEFTILFSTFVSSIQLVYSKCSFVQTLPKHHLCPNHQHPRYIPSDKSIWSSSIRQWFVQQHLSIGQWCIDVWLWYRTSHIWLRVLVSSVSSILCPSSPGILSKSLSSQMSRCRNALPLLVYSLCKNFCSWLVPPQILYYNFSGCCYFTYLII